jgi:hypothetical protein
LTRHRIRTTFSAVGAAAASLAVAAGCGGDGLTANSDVSPIEVITTPTTLGGELTTTAPSAPTPTAAPGDVSSLVAGYAAGYQFSVTVTVGGSVVSTIVGRHIGSNTALAATTNGASVDQVITPDGAWARKSGQDWVPVEIAATSSDPLTALAAAISTTVKADGSIDATYDAENFGLPTGELTAHLTMAGNRLTQARYETSVSGKPTVVVSDFALASDLSVIVAPV